MIFLVQRRSWFILLATLTWSPVISGTTSVSSSVTISSNPYDYNSTTSLEMNSNTTSYITTQSVSKTESSTSQGAALFCTENDYCYGPIRRSDHSITNCACPKTYLNIDNTCCLNQNWIIGIACGAGGLLLVILIGTCICLCISKANAKKIKKQAASMHHQDLWGTPPGPTELPDRNGSRPVMIEATQSPGKPVVTQQTTTSFMPTTTTTTQGQVGAIAAEGVAINLASTQPNLQAQGDQAVAKPQNGNLNVIPTAGTHMDVLADNNRYSSNQDMMRGTTHLDPTDETSNPSLYPKLNKSYDYSNQPKQADNYDKPDYDNESYDNDYDEIRNSAVMRNSDQPSRGEEQQPRDGQSRYRNYGYQPTAMVSAEVAAVASVRPSSYYNDDDFHPQLSKVDSSLNYNIKRPISKDY